MDSFIFLQAGAKRETRRLYVVFGDEPFLKREVLQALRLQVLGPDSDELAVSVYQGEQAPFAEVFDDLQTVPFFYPRRLVLVENADLFVSRFRSLLEKRMSHLPATGVLVLEVKSWPANTRLYKVVGEEAAISCKAPATYKLPAWCGQWCPARHGKQLSSQAATLLVDLVGQEMGLLDQEMEKLAVYIGDRTRIEVADVDKLVGQSRMEITWKIFEAIGAGQVGEALSILGRLLEQGEEPIRLLGAFSMQLRRLAQAARLYLEGTPLAAALEKAGVPSFGLKNAEQQLRHLGRFRALRLYGWLLDLDLGLKGGSPLPPRTLLERFVIKLARPA